ncbi:hypothetical protein [Aquimarina hainanensis]|uniref:hypothetical protein n=1 Tax=Aquimarina hainanensis TaxID=1578017 RepID=UPI00361E178B
MEIIINQKKSLLTIPKYYTLLEKIITEKIDTAFSEFRKVKPDGILFTKKNASWYKSLPGKHGLEGFRVIRNRQRTNILIKRLNFDEISP